MERKIVLEKPSSGNPTCPKCRRWEGMCFDEHSQSYKCMDCAYSVLMEEVEVLPLPHYVGVAMNGDK